MEAILKFNIPEERDEFTLATKAGGLYSVLWDLDQYLRSIHKYGDGSNPEKEDFALKTREKLFEFMDENNVSFDMVS
jgi:hypothetical protein